MGTELGGGGAGEGVDAGLGRAVGGVRPLPPDACDRSTTTLMARPPPASTSLTTADAAASSRSTTATETPADASSSEVARPMPPPPPVTSATFPCNSLIPTARCEHYPFWR